jgi:hypothetical protein
MRTARHHLQSGWQWQLEVGYVGAFQYAEVFSGFTSFYLGVKSVISNVVMDVSFTNSWFDIDREGSRRRRSRQRRLRHHRPARRFHRRSGQSSKASRHHRDLAIRNMSAIPLASTSI